VEQEDPFGVYRQRRGWGRRVEVEAGRWTVDELQVLMVSVSYASAEAVAVPAPPPWAVPRIRISELLIQAGWRTTTVNDGVVC
jgi:hypothetical protein